MDSENLWIPYTISVNKILCKDENFNRQFLVWPILNVFKTKVNIDSNSCTEYVT